MKVYVMDAFTDRIFGGNQAGVVLADKALEPGFGAAVRPMCIEAELLSYLDLIDSRMEIYTENLENTPAGTFSGKIYAIDKKIYNHG